MSILLYKLKKYAVIGALVGLTLSISSIDIQAKEETETAGASLGKPVEEIAPFEDGESAGIALYSNVQSGWIQNDKGWWYQYSNGTWPANTWRKIDNTWYYFDSEGYWVNDNSYEKGSLKGIDISAWQEDIDWSAVKNFGIEFAFIRIGHGTHTVDKYYSKNMQNANAVGIPVGVYFYSTAKSEADAIRDAHFVIDNMKGYKVSYPVVIDLEDSSQAYLTKGQLGTIAKAFCNEIKAAGYTPMLYCNENWYNNYIDVTQVADVEKWIARYNYKYSDSIKRDVWQCCNTGRVDGIQGNCDIDFSYKDYTQSITPRTEPQPGYQKSTGYWVKNSRGWWFCYYAGGYPKSQWEKIVGTWYWFDEDGYMATGWTRLENQWYYLNEYGARHTGWLLLGNTWYYLNEDGVMQTGWLQKGNAQYYLGSGGAMRTGWVLLGGTWYYFNGNGAMHKGWLRLGNTWYYLNADGKMATGMITVGAAQYYLGSGGAMRTGWVFLDGTWYYFSGSGAMHKGWLLLGNTWYYLDADGKMVTGEYQVGGVNYFFASNGSWIKK